jgi:cation transport ATPase
VGVTEKEELTRWEWAILFILAIPLTVSRIYCHLIPDIYPILTFVLIICLIGWGAKVIIFFGLPIFVAYAAERLFEDDDEWDIIYSVAGIEAWVVVVVTLLITCFV